MSKDKAREWTLVGKYVRVIDGDFLHQPMHSLLASLSQIPVGEEVKVVEKSYADELEAKLNYYKDHAEMMKEQWDKAEAKLAECVAAIQYVMANNDKITGWDKLHDAFYSVKK
jgi:hypothetical protein